MARSSSVVFTSIPACRIFRFKSLLECPSEDPGQSSARDSDVLNGEKSESESSRHGMRLWRRGHAILGGFSFRSFRLFRG
jgi:hypothetical protein